MKARSLSVAMLFALLCALVIVPASSAVAKPGKGKGPFKGVQAKGKFGDATLSVTEFAVNAEGKLVAHGVVTSETRGNLGTFRDAPVSVKPGGVQAQQAGALGTLQQAPCDILTLTIQPIFLDLLGLIVETSEINLVITGEPGLLGDLLCAIAGLLDDPSGLAQLLNRILALLGGSLSSGSPLTGALPINISRFFARGDQLFASYTVQDAAGANFGPYSTPVTLQQTEEGCTVLELVIGPLDINLLGLRIQLFGATTEDPVTITIRGETGPGNLLGNLVCGIVGLLDRNAPASAVAAQMNKLLGATS